MSATTPWEGQAEALITFLPSTDLVASRDFYGRVLGLELTVDQVTCLIFRVTADSFLGVCERASARGGESVITTIVSDDVDGWCSKISDAGWAIDVGPEHSSTYGIYHAFLKDPSGNQIEIQRFDDPTWSQP